jgi:hypothetical protein
LKFFTFKHEFLKISPVLRIELAAETRQAEGQCLEEQENLVKFRVFRDCFKARKAMFSAITDIY